MKKRIFDLGQATLNNYMGTRRNLLQIASDLTVRIAALEPVSTLDQMNAVLALEEERKVIVSMIASCSYIIDWLATGRMPGNRRGIERRSGSQREKLTDPSELSRLQERSSRVRRSGSGGEDDDESRMRLEGALLGLTDRERDCYVLAHGECFSFAEIAELLGISKSSVGTYITRAQRKIIMNVAPEIVRVG